MATKKRVRTGAIKKPTGQAKKSTGEVLLHELFDTYRHVDTEGHQKWIQMPNFQRYAGDVGFADPESFAFLFLMYFLECPACGVLTRDSFVRIWMKHEAFSVESQESYLQHALQLFKPQSGSASDLAESRSATEAVYLHTFRLFSTPIPPSADDMLSPFSSKPGIRIPLPVAVEIWHVIFEQPSFKWSTDSCPWLDKWIEFLGREHDDMAVGPARVGETDDDGDGDDDDDERFKPTDSISKHVWGAIPSFSRRCFDDETLDWWAPDQDWPTLIDDFVVWAKAKRAAW